MQPVQPPTNDLQALLTPREFEMAKQRFNDSLIGSEETVKEKLEAFIEEYGEIDELMGITIFMIKKSNLNPSLVYRILLKIESIINIKI